MDKLTTFINRMEKIGIHIKLIGNFPWVYFDTINGKRITERFQSEHGFVIGYTPIRKHQGWQFSDLKAIFKLIRKYGQ